MKIKKIAFVCLIIILGVLSSCTPETFNNLCSVNGVVLEEGTNEPIQGVKVTLKGEDQRNASTGSDGTFFFQNLDASDSHRYDIWAQMPGYETDHVLIAPVPGETIPVTIYLTPKNN